MFSRGALVPVPLEMSAGYLKFEVQYGGLEILFDTNGMVLTLK